MIWKWALHIDLCVIEFSLGDARTALKHGDEECLHIWHLTSNLSIASPNLSCELLTDKINLLKNLFQHYDFWPSELHEKILTLLGKIRLSPLFSKLNWSYNRHNLSAAIWDPKFLLKWDKYCPDHLHLDIKIKVLSVASTWCIRFRPTIYIHQMMTQILKTGI